MDARLTAALKGYRLTFVYALGDAERRLARERYDLVLIGLTFDDSRMFEMLRHVRTAVQSAQVPVVCLRAVPRSGFTMSSEGLRIACDALNASAFLDLTAYSSANEADAALLQTVEGLLKS